MRTVPKANNVRDSRLQQSTHPRHLLDDPSLQFSASLRRHLGAQINNVKGVFPEARGARVIYA